MNLFFVEIASPYSFDLAKELEKNGFSISHVSRTQPIKRKHKNAKIIEARDLYKSKTIYQKHKKYFTNLNIDLINFFKSIESDFFILTDRANHVPITYRKRKLLFYDLIRFWLGYLKKENIDAVYFPCTPHIGWELVLLHACKFLKIPHCYLSHTAINNRSIFRTDYKSLPHVPDKYLSGLPTAQIKKEINSELLEDFEAESIVTNIIKLQNDQFQKQKGTNSKTDQYTDFVSTRNKSRPALLKKIKAAINTIQESASIKNRSFRLSMAMDKNSSPWRWEQAAEKHDREATKLKKYYKEKEKKLSFKKPFIYFPLHLQPELTTQPEAGVFEDHQLALETLLEALPKGWEIYLKENPRQYDVTINTVSGMHFRDNDDIDRFIQDKRVRLVPQDVKTQKLISQSEITVTLTGTAGWESLKMGKPCIVFGAPWYSPCSSCFSVQSVEDVVSALKAAKNKTKTKVKLDLLKYIHFMQDKLKISTLHSMADVSYNSRPYDELLEEHAKALKEFFKA